MTFHHTRAEQERIRAQCYHPEGTYVALPDQELNQSLLPRFSEMVARFPDNIAVCEGERTLTYRELDVAAHRVAKALLTATGPEPVAIALLFGLELEWIIATLGVWKAGKYWVALDLRHPHTRLTTILDDAHTPLILTSLLHDELAASLTVATSEEHARQWLTVEALLADFPADVPAVNVTPESYAYFVYTSGSTGRPKGVIENHVNILHMIAERGGMVHPSSADRIALMLPPAAGGAVYNIVLTLWYGAAIMLFDFAEQGVTRFEDWLLAEGITGMHAGVVLRTWLPTLDGSRTFPALRFLLMGAAPAFREHVTAFQRYIGGQCVLVNPYSSAEVRAATLFAMDVNTRLESPIIPVGFPPSWVSVEIWDENGLPVPADATGEVMIFTERMTPGYWQQPQRTAESFGVDARGRRYYRTGDIGRVDADGCLWVLGRKDRQVKIRGHRVEPAEVEVELLKLTGVREAVIIVHGTRDDETYMAAFVTPEPGCTVDATTLRLAIATRMPNYVVPRLVTVLDELPRNAYGKVDRPHLQNQIDSQVRSRAEDTIDHIIEHVVKPKANLSMNNHQLATRVRRAEEIYAAHMARGAKLFTPEGTSVPFETTGRDQTLLHRWEHMVALYGTRPALVDGTRTLTYIDVNSMANRIAHALLLHDLPKDTPVGLLFDIESDMPIGLMATWKAGHFMAWFEPRQPLERSQLIVADSGAQVVITNRTHASLARQLWPAPGAVIVIEDLEETLSTSNPPNILVPSSPAYLVYTSGSTGTPKGTLENHFNLVHLMAIRETLFQFSPDDRVAFLLYGVGVIFSLAAAWMYGGSFLPFDMKNEGLARFTQWMIEHRITFMVAGAGVRTWLLSLDGSEQFPALRLLGLSTGPTYREHLRAIQRYLPDNCVFTNLYSATEFRIGALAFIDVTAQELADRTLPAGYSLDPGTVEIWGDDGHALGVDVPGEIVVISPYVAVGYWRSPELTAEKFGEDAQGRRYFRTGDLGRIDADGCLWVLGRRDGFVKIRGNRVESAEVETALRALPAVREAAVIVQDEFGEDPALLGFVAADGHVTGQAVRRQLAAHLPDYMLPNSISVLEELPRNANGKVDRPALRALSSATQETLEKVYVNPGLSPQHTFHEPHHPSPSNHHPQGYDYPLTQADVDRSALHRWEHIVERFPMNSALEEGNQVLTYTELNKRMNRLAHAILARAVPKELPIALLFENEGDFPLSIFAVWKAGNFFTWLDPTQPLLRNQYILEDAGASLLITNRRHAAVARQLCPDDQIIVIEEIGEDLPTDNPPIVLEGASTAYLLYTSGSTGKPKGIIDRHRNLLFVFLSRHEVFQFGPHDRLNMLSLASSWSFPVLAAWLYGGCLMPFDAKNEGLTRFGQWLVDQRITISFGGAMLRPWLLTLDGSQQFPDLRGIAIGGGPTYREHIEAYQRYLPDHCMILFTYSATEVRTCALIAVDKQTRIETRLVPAGFPPTGVAVEIWGEDDRPLPVGETGEIIVFTSYAAAGYWKSPELTARQFGVDAQGRRYYRMGDLGRLDEQGCVWILGRKDRQVKIRGNRVETAETEVALLELPKVKEAAVIAVGDTDEKRHLLAFVTVNTEVQGRELRQQLMTRLPDYMVPSTVVVLEELPRNASGKVARPLLRDMAQAFAVAAREPLPVAPTVLSNTERRVAEMVKELLGGRPIGLHDNFYDQGGHSLLAARLMLLVYRTFGVDLAPRDFFVEPTVAALAARVDSILNQQTRSDPAPGGTRSHGIEAVQVLQGAPNNLPIFHCLGWNGAEEMILRYQELIRRLGTEWPLYALVANGTADPATLFTTMDEIVAASLAALRQVQPHGPYLLVGECLGGKLAFELARALEAAGEPIAMLVLMDPPFRSKWSKKPKLKGLAPKFKRFFARWGERVEHHWPRLAALGWRSGTRYVAQRLAALLPHALYPQSTFRPRLLAHKRYAHLLRNYVAREPYSQPTVALFTRNNQHHRAAWQALIPNLEVTFVDCRHRDYLRDAGDEVAAVLGAALEMVESATSSESAPTQTPPVTDEGVKAVL